jgi:hypothetical protein
MSAATAIDHPSSKGLEFRGLATARADALAGWLGAELAIVDAHAPRLVHGGKGLAWGGWRRWLEQCGEALAAERPRVEVRDGLVARVAIPLGGAERGWVAIAAYLLWPVADNEHTRLAAALDIEPGQVRDWLSRHVPTPREAVERLCDLAAARLAAETRIANLEGELEKLTVHLAAMYEEISLIFRLTQNLRISEQPAELAQTVVAWLLELLPAQGLGVLLVTPG